MRSLPKWYLNHKMARMSFGGVWGRLQVAIVVAFSLSLASVPYSVLGCEHEFVLNTEVLRSAHGALVYKRTGQRLDVYSIQVEERFRGVGQAKLLFKEMFRRHPDALVIEALLMYDNERAWMTASGSCEERYRATSFSKLVAPYGFTSILRCEPTKSGIFIEVSNGLYKEENE